MFEAGPETARRWGFLSNHFLVLLCVARDPELRVRDIAASVDITERSTQAILKDLRDEGYVEWVRVGRRSRYRVRRDAALRETMVSAYSVGKLIDALDGESPAPRLVY
jgi:DNA-binding MarR family transcriptional regulator